MSANRTLQRGKLIRVVPRDYNFGALLEESQADRTPQTARTAGYEDYLTRTRVIHIAPLFFGVFPDRAAGPGHAMPRLHVSCERCRGYCVAKIK